MYSNDSFKCKSNSKSTYEDRLRCLHGITKEIQILIPKLHVDLYREKETNEIYLQAFGITHDVKIQIRKINLAKDLNSELPKDESVKSKNTKTSAKDSKCNLCEKTYKLKTSLPRHMKGVHKFKRKMYSCSVSNCAFQGVSILNVKRHLAEVHNQRPFACRICCKSFKANEALTNHMKSHREVKQYKCDYEGCGYESNNKTTLNIHASTHKEERPFRCSTCGYGLKTKSNLWHHTKAHFQVKQFKCQYEGCNYRCHEKRLIRDHTTVYHSKGQKRFPCDFQFCQKSFSRLYQLQRHILTNHTPELIVKNHKCPFCKYKTISKDSLQSHIRVHTYEKPFKCKLCEYSASRQFTLKVHLKTHTGEKPFSCSFCKKQFSQISNLNCHLRTHTGEKPYSCSICKKAFSVTSALKSHMQTHTRDKPYYCSICKKTFCRKFVLSQHIKRIHTGEKLL